MSRAVTESVLGVLDADTVFRESAGMVMPEFMKGDSKAGRWSRRKKAASASRKRWRRLRRLRRRAAEPGPEY
ncbi:hypothetical protein [Sporomusa sp. KB1]|uniref:hypothetical protein n=1 Tax=Sporomusa sp. KB1 TaxID=943346 RepID=UPI0011A9BEF3|nr:hypothetical protein [Sporomusa sp. KB1]